MHVIDVMVMVMDIVYRIEVVMHVKDVMANGDGSDGHCSRIEAVMHVIDVMAMVMEVMDFVIGSKLSLHVIDHDWRW